MGIYDLLSRNTLARKRYALKFFLVALPLIILALAELILFILMSQSAVKLSLPVIVTLVLFLIVFGAALMLYLFTKLVTPLTLAKYSLDEYLVSHKIPDLPLNYEDEAGELLANIQETITQLDKLIVEKSDMVDLLSHDVRSPVGRILSLSNLIKTDSDEKDLYADYITNECMGLLSMLENILLILREESSEFKLEFVNLNKLIQETLSFYQFSAAEKSLTMKVSIDESIYIPIQEQLFKQAIRNIIGNAIKFSPDGKTISISGEQDADLIKLRIKDEGLGFKQDDIQKIFNRFTSAGKKGTHGEASTGLGLYLSKKIVEKHGGMLVAESGGENKGATFTFVLYRLVIKKPQDKLGRKQEMKPIVTPRAR